MRKKNEGRFTVQFNDADPAHLQAMEVLNCLRPRSKAPYLVEAILHFENCEETPTFRRVPKFDEKAIEAIVRRVLAKDIPMDATPVPDTPTGMTKLPVRASGDIDFSDAIEAIGEENMQAILGAVNAFRS